MITITIMQEFGIALMVIGGVGAGVGTLVSAPIAIRDALKTRKGKDAMSRSEPENVNIIWADEDPFGTGSGYEGDSLKEARAWMAKRFRNGEMTCCMACGQSVQQYSRSIYKRMVDGLEYLANNGGTKSEKLRIEGGGDYAKLEHWGLIEKYDSDNKWHITFLGLQFLRGQAVIPKYVYVYNATVLGRSEDMVTVYDCTDKGYSFQETVDPRNIADAAE